MTAVSRPYVWRRALSLLLACGAVALGWVAYGHHPSPAAQTAALPTLGLVEPFALTERDGSRVDLARLHGQIWVANFMFTRCTGPCPLMSGYVKTLQKHFATEPRLRFVSISTDPAHDTPAALRAYAERFGADPQRWLFLTGDKTTVVHLSRDVFKLAAGDDPGMHSTRFVLVDADGRIRGYYDSRDPDFQARLQADAEALARALPATAAGKGV